jgi:hypothetical protein
MPILRHAAARFKGPGFAFAVVRFTATFVRQFRESDIGGAADEPPVRPSPCGVLPLRGRAGYKPPASLA